MADLNPLPRRFVTGVEASDAILPSRPQLWSYSSLKAIEACPRQYMLSRAAYPDFWSGNGYPRLPIPAVLMGQVMHNALEVLVKALVKAGCESPKASSAVEVLESLGGLTAVVEQTVGARLDDLQTNPRVGPEHYRRLVRDLKAGVADARAQLQEYLSRATFSSKPTDDAATDATPATRESAASGRRPAGPGLHTEKPLADENLRLMGVVDLLDVAAAHASILDYKTGAEDPAHVEQLQLYALLWDLDRVVNPTAVPATELTAAYPNRDVTIPAPAPAELRALEESARDRIAAADALFDADVPPAKPSLELCRLCHVRHLCDAYWASLAPDPSAVKDGEWFDYECVVGPPNASRSQWMLNPSSGQRDLLLRTTATSKPLKEGARVRILGLQRNADPEVKETTARMTASSEVFVIAKVSD